MLVGGLFHRTQTFNAMSNRTSASLLFLACLGIAIPTAASHLITVGKYKPTAASHLITVGQYKPTAASHLITVGQHTPYPPTYPPTHPPTSPNPYMVVPIPYMIVPSPVGKYPLPHQLHSRPSLTANPCAPPYFHPWPPWAPLTLPPSLAATGPTHPTSIPGRHGPHSPYFHPWLP